MSSWRSYHAALFSVRWLFRGFGDRQLWEMPAPDSCYLWTLTAPTEEMRRNAKKCLACFKCFAEDRSMRKKVYLRVLEESEKGYWHFHIVTPEWWDVNEIRTCAEEHGFGRVNVKRIPVVKATYVCKYIMKSRKLPAGCRKWACHGFKGVRSSDVYNKICEATLVPFVYDGILWESVCYAFGANGTKTFPLRVALVPGSPVTKMIEIKSVSQKLVLTEAVSGFIAVGEYRSSKVRTVTVEKKGGGGEEPRVIVEHNIEVAGEAFKFSEWLRSGSDASAVKPVAKQGDCVLAVINKLSSQYGAGLVRLIVL